MSVSRETVARTVARFPVGRPEPATDAILALLAALAAEPDPPTTVRDPAHALEVHVADSLAALEIGALRNAARIADIGAGAGFPGLVLAIALPRAEVDLIEATRRKCDVIDRLAAAAGVEDRARGVPARAEEWAAEHPATYDAVTARALAPLSVICEYAAPLLRDGGTLVAWKGARDPDEETSGRHAAAILGFGSPKIIPVTPYDTSENRHLYVYSKVKETPANYPRRAGMAAKKPVA
jgi:16S rRNA (guanine527-N7)-methyltransferase